MSWDALRVAATDRASGSSTIAARAARAFAQIAATLSEETIVSAGRTLVRGQPIMAACLRLVDVVLRALDEAGAPGAQRAAEAMAIRLDEEKRTSTEALRRRVPSNGTVLTVSASSNVIGALSSSPGIRVLCAASEPGGEGTTAVERLRASGVDATLIPDGVVAQQSTRADVVVFGADALGPDALLNKTGTLAAALGARSNGHPTLCIAGTTKLIDAHAWPKLLMAAERLKLEGMPVFEEVPSSLVTTFVTENGATTARALRRTARNAGLHPLILGWLDG